ncbi:Crp/Fnr family transcriptional regulator [Inhella sp.]|uniref:Crp/Fnr family transcriptional regulator n=1 Tax=Inhella sp. TaxID=1921806 RepID=UPI0035B1E934
MLMPRTILLKLAPTQTEACRGCGVRDAALFGALSERGLERLHEAGDEMGGAGGISSVHLPADRRMYALGAQGGAVFTVREGLVRLERVSAAGRRCIVRLAGPGDLLGAEALLGERYTDDAVACTDLALCRIPVPVLELLRKDEPALQLALMRRWQQALDAALTWRIDLQAGPASQRVLRLFAQLSRQAAPGEPIWLPRREELADLLDMAMETASRAVSALRRDGVIELMPGGRRARLDAGALARALAKSNGTPNH